MCPRCGRGSAGAAEFDLFLRKPVDPMELVGAVARLTGWVGGRPVVSFLDMRRRGRYQRVSRATATTISIGFIGFRKNIVTPAASASSRLYFSWGGVIPITGIFAYRTSDLSHRTNSRPVSPSSANSEMTISGVNVTTTALACSTDSAVVIRKP